MTPRSTANGGPTPEIFTLGWEDDDPALLTSTPYAHGDLTWLRTDDDRNGRLYWCAGHDPVPQCGAAIWSIDIVDQDPRLETRDDDVCEIGLRATTDLRDAAVIVAAGLGTWLRWLDGEVAHDDPDGDIRTVAAHRDPQQTRIAMVRSTATAAAPSLTPRPPP